MQIGSEQVQSDGDDDGLEDDSALAESLCPCEHHKRCSARSCHPGGGSVTLLGLCSCSGSPVWGGLCGVRQQRLACRVCQRNGCMPDLRAVAVDLMLALGIQHAMC